MAEEEKVAEVVKNFFEKRYGQIEYKISRIYTRGGFIEVSGDFRSSKDSRMRRFTFLIDSKSYAVVGFGLR
ncbi:MAG: hypothetical protein NZ956_03195 [Candidatus Caldarchaeum sp.]|nr:hypothetical protein [Candidatus Caldarchaeum sp.]